MRCFSASAAILTVVAGVFFLLQGLPACPNGGAPQDLSLPPPPPPPPKALLLALGVITAPGHFNRRVWMRQKLRVTEARRRGVGSASGTVLSGGRGLPLNVFFHIGLVSLRVPGK